MYCVPLTSFLLLVAGQAPLAEVRKPITRADSVLAVYSSTPLFEKGLVIAVWPDGHVVWSGDRLAGGTPYRAGRIEPKRVSALLSQCEEDGLFGDEKLNEPHLSADTAFTTVLVKSGKKKLEMVSIHELDEASGGFVGWHHTTKVLGRGERRLDELRKNPADYLYYRLVWSETRGKIADLIPGESKPVSGNLVRDGDTLSWQEEPAPQSPKGKLP